MNWFYWTIIGIILAAILLCAYALCKAGSWFHE